MRSISIYPLSTTETLLLKFFSRGTISSFELLPNLIAASIKQKINTGSPALLRIGPIEVGWAAISMTKHPTASHGHLCFIQIAIPDTNKIKVSNIGAIGELYMPNPAMPGEHS